MRKILVAILWAMALAALSIPGAGSVGRAFAQVSSPTPTYDPLAEPPLPANPTEFELGRNLFWHWCMTCHGDRGQGLTDAFREIWDKDHQNCWARGCHAGHNGDLGFPIPTVIPLIIGDDHLARFTTLQDLIDFLKTTHPPQSPGILKADEYHAIAVYVFTQNDRSLVVATSTPKPAPTLPPFATSIPIATPNILGSPSGLDLWPVIILAVVLLAVLAWLLVRGRRDKK